MSGEAILFDDVFEVQDVDKDGKKFDRVSRVTCRGEATELDLSLDVHSELFKLKSRDKFRLLLARTLRYDGREMEDAFDQSDEKTLADEYDYVCHGKVFMAEPKKTAMEVYISFGGLLMVLKGDARNLARPFEIDQRVFLLCRLEQ